MSLGKGGSEELYIDQPEMSIVKTPIGIDKFKEIFLQSGENIRINSKVLSGLSINHDDIDYIIDVIHTNIFYNQIMKNINNKDRVKTFIFDLSAKLIKLKENGSVFNFADYGHNIIIPLLGVLSRGINMYRIREEFKMRIGKISFEEIREAA